MIGVSNCGGVRGNEEFVDEDEGDIGTVDDGGSDCIRNTILKLF